MKFFKYVLLCVQIKYSNGETMYTSEKKKVIRNERSIFRDLDRCSCFHLKTNRAGFDSRALAKRRSFSPFLFW